jgi:hypothetical protein
MMGRRDHRPPAGRLAAVGMMLYAVFLIASPFAHHDFVCELKSPLHCTACTSNVAGSDPASPAALGTCTLTDVGRAAPVLIVAAGTQLSVRTTGRSPPVSTFS